MKTSKKLANKGLKLKHINIFFVISFCLTANANEIINISNLNQSLTWIENKALDVKVIEKTWSETFDGNRRFYIRFFGIFDKPDFVKQYWQLIPIYENSKKIELSQWESADCSIEQAIVNIDDEKSLFIIASYRYDDNTSNEILSQNVATKQLIKIFKLTRNLDQKPGLPSVYFLKTQELITSEKVCTLQEVDKILRLINP